LLILKMNLEARRKSKSMIRNAKYSKLQLSSVTNVKCVTT